ncbi:hypothetical protein D3C72_1935380 [compost metagenome]
MLQLQRQFGGMPRQNLVGLGNKLLLGQKREVAFVVGKCLPEAFNGCGLQQHGLVGMCFVVHGEEPPLPAHCARFR